VENKIEERIKNVMSLVFELPVEQIKDDSSPDTIESWDSLKHMNLVIALEDEFNCEFADSETVEIVSYKLILVIITEHIVADN
jgi:acyl carrier protein